MTALLLLHASLIDRWAVRPSPVVAARSLAPAQMQASDSFPSRKVVRNQLTPAQVDALLTRVVELEARIDNLEGGANAGAVVGRIGRNVFSHIGTTARRLSGRAPLPGLRRAPVRTIEGAVEGVVAPTSRRALQIGGITNASAALVGDQYAKAVGAGSAIVGKAVGAAAAAQSAVGSAVGAASSTIGGITNVSVGTTLEKSVAVIDLGAEGVVQRLSKTGDLIDKEVQSLSTEVTSKAAAGAESSQSLVVACMGVGALAGALAPLFLWRGAPAIGAAGGACIFAYACTLNNRVGKVVRLAGVLVLVLLSRISNYFREMRRQGEFVYKTGRWFEQLDREVRRARSWPPRPRAFASPARASSPAPPTLPPPTAPRSLPAAAGAEAAHEDGQRRRLSSLETLRRGGEWNRRRRGGGNGGGQGPGRRGRRAAGLGGLGGEQVDERYGRLDRGAD